MHILDIKSALRAIRHHRREMTATVVTILAIGAYLIWSLPAIYISDAKILVEREGLYADTNLQSTPQNDNISRRMHAIVSMVMSTDSIKEILLENGVVDATIDDEELNLAVREFREKANVTFDNVAVINQYTGKTGMYSQGLIISYENESPDTALSVTQALTDRVLKAKKGKGEKAVEYRQNFLVDQYDRALQVLDTAKDAVAAFKKDNALYLPEVQPLALQRYEQVEAQYLRAQENIERLRRMLSDVQGELATSSADAYVLAPDGTRVLGADEQIRLLEAEYARALARYTTQHPEVVRLRTELDGLRQYAGGGSGAGIEAELQQTRRDLAAAEQRYSDDHPDVRALQRKVDSLELSLASLPKNSAPSAASSATSPAYNRILIRERAVRDDISVETQKLASLSNEMTDIEQQLARMPSIDQRLSTLLQKQEVAQTSYEEIESEIERLNLSFGMQQADLLDRFVLLEAPGLPLRPAKPRRKLLAMVLAMLAGTAGLLVAIVMYIVRDRLIDPEDVEALVDLPVYMIPKVA